jgi:hypothetical protein
MNNLLQKYNSGKIKAQRLFYEFFHEIGDSFDLTSVNTNVEVEILPVDSAVLGSNLVNFQVSRHKKGPKYIISCADSEYLPLLLRKEAYFVI